MRLLITGSSKLAGYLHTKYFWPRDWCIDSARIEDILCGDVPINDYDVFLNCAHVDFKQCWLLEHFHYAWLKDSSKYIINFSSRAAKPNISKGLLYSTQKAALNHLSDLITYTTEREYRMTVLNLGLLWNPSEYDDYYIQDFATGYRQVGGLLGRLIEEHELGFANETSEITFQHKTNYREAQELKSEQQRTR